MTLNTTRQQRRALKAENRKWPDVLRRIPESEWGPSRPPRAKEVWRSREYLVQVFQEDDEIERLSICHTAVEDNDWVEGISWDDLQRLKRECGRAERDAVEVFPADADVVHVANMRHLWVLPYELPFKWKAK